MAAPATAYFLIDFKFRGSNDVEMTVNPAKAQAIKATLLTRFYLDDVVGFKANYGGTEYHGFWGIVLPSGYNYDHHNPSRLLEINVPKPGQVLRMFNDAGLNTKGHATNVRIPNPLVGLESGIIVPIKVIADFLSAWYVATDDHGVEWLYKEPGSLNFNWMSVLTGGMAQQQSSSNEEIAIPGMDRGWIVPGYRLYVRPIIINAEGKYTGPTVDVSVMAAYQVVLSDYSYEGQFAACAHLGSGTVKTVYSERGVFQIGDTLYLDVSKTTTATAGSYGYEWTLSNPKFLSVNAAGVITNYGNCPRYLFFEIYGSVDETTPEARVPVIIGIHEINGYDPQVDLTYNGTVRVGDVDFENNYFETDYLFSFTSGAADDEWVLMHNGEVVTVDTLVGSANIISATVSPGSSNVGGNTEQYQLENF